MTKGKQGKIIRIASYNIRKSIGLDWKRNATRILDVLSEINADIIALQEADKRLGERQGTLPVDMLEKDLGYKFADVGGYGSSHGWHGNAILYRLPFTFISCYKIKIPTLGPRGAICSVFETSEKKALRLIGTHLSLLGYIRARQVKFLSRFVQNNTPHLPTIIAGDFNEWRHAGKAYRAAGDGFKVITPGPSFHSANPKIPLDRFVLSGDVEVENQGVHDTALSRKASDHLPIFVDIALN